jgi:hypothetical protein
MLQVGKQEKKKLLPTSLKQPLVCFPTVLLLCSERIAIQPWAGTGRVSISGWNVALLLGRAAANPW